MPLVALPVSGNQTFRLVKTRRGSRKPLLVLSNSRTLDEVTVFGLSPILFCALVVNRQNNKRSDKYIFFGIIVSCLRKKVSFRINCVKTNEILRLFYNMLCRFIFCVFSLPFWFGIMVIFYRYNFYVNLRNSTKWIT
jgi:hypothetical protein